MGSGCTELSHRTWGPNVYAESQPLTCVLVPVQLRSQPKTIEMSSERRLSQLLSMDQTSSEGSESSAVVAQLSSGSWSTELGRQQRRKRLCSYVSSSWQLRRKECGRQ